MYKDETVLHYLKLRASESGDAMAAVGAGGVTYAELDDMSDRIAASLLHAGVTVGECVGVGYDHCLEALLSILGILKAGAVYVPLNPEYPASRLEYMMDDAGVKVVLGGRSGLDVVPLAGGGKAELPEVGPKDRMAIIYTSGSSGVPKGVILNHENPMGSAAHYMKTVGVGNEDVLASYASQSFVIAMHDLCVGIAAGAALCYIPGTVRTDMRVMAEYFESARIAHVVVPASLGREFAKVARPGALRSMTFVGEAFFPPDTAPGCRIYNGYGTTEIAGFACIGVSAKMQPIDGVGLRLDGSGKLVVSGPCVGEAYLNAPASFGGEFCTGDLAEIDDAGEVTILGRSDFQIKIRGNRVQPEEIDFNARKLQDVDESVTVTEGGRLATYFTGIATPSALKRHLEGTLPQYMIPPVIVRMESLPRRPTGKIDLAALRGLSREGGAARARNNCSPLRTETERWLAGVWKNLIEAEIPGSDAVFEDLGGDSLTVMLLALQIESSFGKIISPAELLAAATLKAQAELIDAASTCRVAAYNESGRLDPLFFVHSANSGAEAYRRFVAALPENQPFYVFENHNVLFSEGRFEGIAELARRYVGYLPPRGHYRLGGWSLGGLIAFEMGLILMKQGIMSDLYLIDPYIMTSDAERELNAGLETEQLYFRDYLNRDALFERFRDAGLIERLVSNNNFVRREAARYSPAGIFGGKTVLFKAMRDDPCDSEALRRLWEMKSSDNGFSRFTKDLRIVQIDSTHDRWMNDLRIIKTIVSEVMVETMKKNLIIHATVENLVTAQEFVVRELQGNGFPAKAVTQAMIAIEEIFVNIAHYAYDGKGNVEISFSMEEGTAVITFTDTGKPYNPLEAATPDVTLTAKDRPIGGLGIFMTRQLTDGIEYERVDECNILRIRKTRITPE